MNSSTSSDFTWRRRRRRTSTGWRRRRRKRGGRRRRLFLRSDMCTKDKVDLCRVGWHAALRDAALTRAFRFRAPTTALATAPSNLHLRFSIYHLCALAEPPRRQSIGDQRDQLCASSCVSKPILSSAASSAILRQPRPRPLVTESSSSSSTPPLGVTEAHSHTFNP